MELPFTVVFEPPSHAELRALLRMRGYWAAGLIVALTIGTAYVLANVARADARAATLGASLEVLSRPSGASVWIDGQPRGATPLHVRLDTGTHGVMLKNPGAIDAQYAIDLGSGGAALQSVLWRRQPGVTRLRPALPGARLEDVRVLEDGSLGLSVALPPGRELQAWRLDPLTGGVEAVVDSGIAGARLTFASDGQHLAYLGPEIGPPWRRDVSTSFGSSEPMLGVLWLVERHSTEQPVGTRAWRAPLEPGEELTDVSWSPARNRLLVIASELLQGGVHRTRAWFLSTDLQQTVAALSIPSEVVPGSESWSPDGQYVTFVAHAGQVNAVCLLGLDGTFRYVADLDQSDGSPPAGYPPVAWSSDSQRMLFVAPRQHPPDVAFDWLQPQAQHAMYVASVDRPTPVALTDTLADQVTWREDGQVLGLWRANSDTPLSIRLLNDSGGSGAGLLDLPLKIASTYTAVWDLSHANLLIAAHDSAFGSATAYWLARLGVEADQ